MRTDVEFEVRLMGKGISNVMMSIALRCIGKEVGELTELEDKEIGEESNVVLPARAEAFMHMNVLEGGNSSHD